MFSEYWRITIVLLALGQAPSTSSTLVEEILGVIRLGSDIGKETLKFWDVVNENLNAPVSIGLSLWERINKLQERQERSVIAQLNYISEAIRKVEVGVDEANIVSLMLAKNSGRTTRMELKLHEMADLLSRVTSADRQMRQYVGLQHKLERSTLQEFAEWCISPDPGALPGLLERIHSLIVPTHNYLLGTGLLQLILEDIQEDGTDACALEMSPHQLIYDIYNTIALTEIKGQVLMQFSWIMLRIQGKGNFTEEASLSRQRYAERASESTQIFRNALASASRNSYRCYPSQHVEGETYDQITRLFQGYIENEVDMNKGRTCDSTCSSYKSTSNYGCLKDKFCEKQTPCKGNILQCEYVSSSLTVCPASSQNNNRRYEWIQLNDIMTYGKVGTCPQATINARSWSYMIFWNCFYCMCYCDDATDSDRYFSLWESTSDVYNNKVVTGIRLVKHGRVFHLQVHEGTLKESGFVEAGDWVPVQKFDPYDWKFDEGDDYHNLTLNSRAIDLDELDSPAGSVLTGVRFRMIGTHLNFEIRSTPFNYTTGRLSPDKNEWIGNSNTEDSRSMLEFYKPDIPTASRKPLPVDSKHNQYLNFYPSDLEADAAQSTIPFIDVQPVLPGKGSTLVTGAGIIHRGARYSGGFLAVKLKTYPYQRHVKVSPSPQEVVENDKGIDSVPKDN